VFAHTTARIEEVKKNLEGELDAIQVHVRENKDKQAELTKKFQLATEKITKLGAPGNQDGMSKTIAPTSQALATSLAGINLLDMGPGVKKAQTTDSSPNSFLKTMPAGVPGKT